VLPTGGEVADEHDEVSTPSLRMEFIDGAAKFLVPLGPRPGVLLGSMEASKQEHADTPPTLSTGVVLSAFHHNC
jgi:hypothetical protein